LIDEKVFGLGKSESKSTSFFIFLERGTFGFLVFLFGSLSLMMLMVLKLLLKVKQKKKRVVNYDQVKKKRNKIDLERRETEAVKPLGGFCLTRGWDINDQGESNLGHRFTGFCFFETLVLGQIRTQESVISRGS
jgi:heme exporter protein D